MVESLLVELSLVIFVCFLVSAVMRLLNQPLILGYIFTGIIVSPYGLHLVQSQDGLSALARLGVELLLFMVGLHLDLKLIKDIGKMSLIAGFLKVAVTSIIGFFLAKMLGFDTITSWYLALAFAFSSTIIIMKLLSDRSDAETLFGRITIGILIVQDLIVILLLMIISSFSSNV